VPSFDDTYGDVNVRLRREPVASCFEASGDRELLRRHIEELRSSVGLERDL
jgi:hypothetical protein